jgi:hypothetical protein
MFKAGDKVRAVPSLLNYIIAEMLENEVGTVTNLDDQFREVVVHFPNTERPGGLFAMDENQIELA